MSYIPTYTEKKKKKIDRWKKKNIKNFFKSEDEKDWSFGLVSVIKNGIRYVLSEDKTKLIPKKEPAQLNRP